MNGAMNSPIHAEVELWRNKCEILLQEKLDLAQRAGDDARSNNQQIIALMATMHANIAQKDSIIEQLCLSRDRSQVATVAVDASREGSAIIRQLEEQLRDARNTARNFEGELNELRQVHQSRSDQRTIEAAGMADIESLKAQLVRKNEEISQLGIEASQMKTEILTNISTIENQAETLERKEGEITSLRTVINGKQSKDEQSSKYIAYLRKRLLGLESQLGEVKMTLRESRMLPQELEADLRNQIETLILELDTKSRAAANDKKSFLEHKTMVDECYKRQKLFYLELESSIHKEREAVKLRDEAGIIRETKLLQEIDTLKRELEDKQQFRKQIENSAGTKSHDVVSSINSSAEEGSQPVANKQAIGGPAGQPKTDEQRTEATPATSRTGIVDRAGLQKVANSSTLSPSGLQKVLSTSSILNAAAPKIQEQPRTVEPPAEIPLSTEDISLLEIEYLKNKFPKKEERQSIADVLTQTRGQIVVEPQIHAWYVNKRLARDSKTPQQPTSTKWVNPSSAGSKDHISPASATPGKARSVAKNTPKSQKSTPRREKNTPAHEKLKHSGTADLEVRTPDKHLARPGAPQGPDGLQRLTELIFIALKAAKDSGSPSPNKVIETILHLECISEAQPLTESQLDRIHALIVKSFPLIAPWQIQAWKAAIEKMRLHVLSVVKPKDNHTNKIDSRTPTDSQIDPRLSGQGSASTGTKSNSTADATLSQPSKARLNGSDSSTVTLTETDDFKCTECNSQPDPSTLTNLIHHWQTAHVDTPKKCPICPLETPTYSLTGLLSHFKSVHSKSFSPVGMEVVDHSLQSAKDASPHSTQNSSKRDAGTSTTVIIRDSEEESTSAANPAVSGNLKSPVGDTAHSSSALEQAEESSDARAARLDIRQSNRCTTCIESHKYCNGEPICETCRTYYLGWGLPEKYCIYPFVKKDIPQWKITPKDFIPPSSMNKELLNAILSPANNFGKFWRPTTDEDFPELTPSAKSKIRGQTPTKLNKTGLKPVQSEKKAIHINISDGEDEFHDHIGRSARRSAKRRKLFVADSSNSEAEESAVKAKADHSSEKEQKANSSQSHIDTVTNEVATPTAARTGSIGPHGKNTPTTTLSKASTPSGTAPLGSVTTSVSAVNATPATTTAPEIEAPTAVLTASVSDKSVQ